MDATLSGVSALLMSMTLAVVLVPVRAKAMSLSTIEIEPRKLEQPFLTHRHRVLIAQSATAVTPFDDNGMTRLDITGGTRAGDNLFHSFEQFGVDANQIANFISQPGIQNILSRVTGGVPSIINGIVTVTGGEPNLFLMNPSGIIIGNNARLDVPADFIATTATGIEFEDGWFSASGDNDYERLVGEPIGFSFNFEDPETQPGIIINTGQFSGNTLSLIGGFFPNLGQTTSEQSNIEVTPVPGENLVRISQPGNLLSLEIEPPNQEIPSNVWSISILDLPELLTRGARANAIDAEIERINDGSKTFIRIQFEGVTEVIDLDEIDLDEIDFPIDGIGRPTPDDPPFNPPIIIPGLASPPSTPTSNPTPTPKGATLLR